MLHLCFMLHTTVSMHMLNEVVKKITIIVSDEYKYDNCKHLSKQMYAAWINTS